MDKYITYKQEARRAMERGFDILTEAVAITLGPKGRNVVLEKKFGVPQIVNDGITIAKEIELENHVENTAVSLLRQTAAKTSCFKLKRCSCSYQSYFHLKTDICL